MFSDTSRRDFLRTGSLGTLMAALGDVSFLAGLPRVSAADAAPDPKIVRFSPEIEPLVRLIEDTPRNRLLEAVAERVRKGVTYREVLAALQLAGVRNVQPRPAVGFKFHAVLVVNSAHLAAMSSPEEHRWLPIFWALDYFKEAQARDVQEGNWTMGPVDESAVPAADRARAMFVEAMDSWDEAKADAAAAGLARHAGEKELFEIFCRYGARDFRSIGHKAIFVANGSRTLQTIGRQHAEPIIRSLAYALLNHEGADNPAKNDYEADRPWKTNTARALKLRKDWQSGKADEQATRDLMSTFYSATADDACDQAVELLNRGIGPQSIWDAIFLQGGELLMRQPGIVGLHTLTTTNALHYAYNTVTDDHARRMLLLQNIAFLPMFREAMKARGKVQPTKLLELEPLETKRVEKSGTDKPAAETVAQIFGTVSSDRMQAARQTLAYAAGGTDVKPFIDAARLLVYFKGRDSHDYKFSAAVLEDLQAVSPKWRDRFLAASVFHLPGSGAKDNPLVQRTREALSA
jgi:hypothetical protein